MAQPYIGEIRMFGGNFAPQGWALCNGQILAISDYDVLFQLIGTTYGGNGQTTFGLPNLQSRVPVHQGTGPGLSNYVIGQVGGVETVTLTNAQMPSHTHAMVVSTGVGSYDSGTGRALGVPSSGMAMWRGSGTTNVQLSGTAVNAAGGSQPHDNIQPYLAIRFIISLFGVFPSQN